MHVAKQLKSENLRIQIQDRDAVLDDLFPQSHKLDRFGCIITEPYGSFGASLLIQAAIVQFYETHPQRRDTQPMYPEIYMFHVGGSFGDHSSFDFWPPRKEVQVDAANPAALLSAIVDKGITRLALPDGVEGDPELLKDSINSFADLGSGRNLFESCFAYNPSGQTGDADVFLASEHPSFEANIRRTLEREELLEKYDESPALIGRPGPTSGLDVDRWIDTVRSEWMRWTAKQ
ncbi:MAG: hypothetical protein HLX51_07630 [Micrococcaceae bacterium]|nr:hypothetical protein [Micrococcaceae bacterium]